MSIDETTPLNGAGQANGDADDSNRRERHVSIAMPNFQDVLERRNSRYRRQSSAIHALNAAEQIREHEKELLTRYDGGDDAGGHHTGHRRQSVFDIRNPERGPTRMEAMYGAVVDVHEVQQKQDRPQSPIIQNLGSIKEDGGLQQKGNIIQRIASQIPAIVIVSVLNCMVGIPFGASYFPVGWSSSSSSSDAGADDSGGDMSDGVIDDVVSGNFPLGGKEALGLRMFLFSTAMAQLIFTFTSNFNNGICLQMVENVPFCLELANIVINEQGYGIDSLSTLFFLFGFSSLLVGLVFYLLGHFKMGRVVYFFPSHVLVGCIGGIGLFIVITAIEVSTNTEFEFSLDGLSYTFVDNFPLIGVVLVFEVTLRILIQLTRDENGRPRYPLLGPIYYICITPVFYIFFAILGVSSDDASDASFFFPSLESGDDGKSSSIIDDSLFDIFTIVNFSTISWTAVAKSIPTIVSLTAFSLIHVPINIPAFAISTNVEPDMDKELVAHGWSNAAAGLFGGLQNYMAYSNSVIYSKSGGRGIGSSLAIVVATVALFIVGPTITSYVPRCMAGTLLLHIGIDLFLEGVKDSWGDYDALEYSGIWLITVVMVVFGMSAALIAGAVAALSVYLFQSITHQNPIKGQMSAVSLRSSAWNRSVEARAILEDKTTGRHKIHLILLQVHIFFGNVFLLTDAIKSSLNKMRGTDEEPKIVILDFTSVLGLDSSAAQAIAKLKTTMHNKYGIVLSIFVTGSTDGFPCEYNLSGELSESIIGKLSGQSCGNGTTANDDDADDDNEDFVDDAFACLADEPESTALLSAPRMSMSIKASTEAASSIGTSMKQAVLSSGIPSSRVCDTLDEALVFAEDVLIALEDSLLLEDDLNETTRHFKMHRSPSTESAHDEEKLLALRYLEELCPAASGDEVETLLSLFSRERHVAGDVLWTQGSSSDCCKLLVVGSLLSSLEDGSCLEDIAAGSTIGELGLVHKTERLSTVTCVSDRAVLFSLSRENWEELLKSQPALANHILHLVVRYLAHRVQHVSNRVLESRSLPV